ncbi:MAG: hypothetical protein ACI9DF_001901, partial [Verrucomicrobiales bacterium]
AELNQLTILILTFEITARDVIKNETSLRSYTLHVSLFN